MSVLLASSDETMMPPATSAEITGAPKNVANESSASGKYDATLGDLLRERDVRRDPGVLLDRERRRTNASAYSKLPPPSPGTCASGATSFRSSQP